MIRKGLHIIMFLYFVVLAGTIFLWPDWAEQRWKRKVSFRPEIHISPENYSLVTKKAIEQKIMQTDTALFHKNPDLYVKLLEKEIEKMNWVDNAEVYYSPAGNLEVEIQQFKPVVYVLSGSQKKYMDMQGKIRKISPHANMHLPVIQINDYNPDLKSIRYLVRKLMEDDNIRSRFYAAKMQNGNISLRLRGLSARVILGDTGGLDDKIFRLKAMLSMLRKNKKENQYIQMNLQYNGQVICQKN